MPKFFSKMHQQNLKNIKLLDLGNLQNGHI